MPLEPGVRLGFYQVVSAIGAGPLGSREPLMLDRGTKLGPYEVVSSLGAGGMGEVYRAHDTALGRDVAIKVPPDAFAADAERLARFEREARLLASLNHPNIAAIYGLERTGAATCLVMELAAGETLAARIARTAGLMVKGALLRTSGASARQAGLPIDEALPIALQVAAALEAAHEKGVVHHDLKPANIVVSPEGKVKVLDFGLARLAVRLKPGTTYVTDRSTDLPAPPALHGHDVELLMVEVDVSLNRDVLSKRRA